MTYLLGFLIALVIGLLFNYGAYKTPTPGPGNK